MFFVSSLMGLGACAQESGRSVMEIWNGLKILCEAEKRYWLGMQKSACLSASPTNRSSASIEEAEEPERNFVVACHLDVVACKDGVCSRLDAAQAVADADFR